MKTIIVTASVVVAVAACVAAYWHNREAEVYRERAAYYYELWRGHATGTPPR